MIKSPTSIAVATALAFGTLVPQVARAEVNLDNLLSILQATNDGGWAKVSLNAFSSAWPDASDTVLAGSSYANPLGVIRAWSSFAWDSKRGDLILFGGGHANYAGNEVYRWHGTTQQWERASLPSDVVLAQAAQSIYIAKDGGLNAPMSQHTYDNNEYLAVADRFITLGGAAFNSGGGQFVQNQDGSLRSTGPYLWDPSKADGNKVGGTSGSGVDITRQGGSMWQNRDTVGTLTTVTGLNIPIGAADGTTAATVENGKDVIYFTSSQGKSHLMKYTINDVNDPSKDTVQVVGGWFGGAEAYGAAGFDPVTGLYVALSTVNDTFVVWDTHAPNGFLNLSTKVTPTLIGATEFKGDGISGLDWDPETGSFLIWSGTGDVWELKAPTSGVISDQWTLELVTDGSTFADGQAPAGGDWLLTGGGVRGKWKYISNLHAFMALDGTADGSVWLYRPDGWTNPVPEPETYAMLLGGLGILALAMRRRQVTHA